MFIYISAISEQKQNTGHLMKSANMSDREEFWRLGRQSTSTRRKPLGFLDVDAIEVGHISFS